MSPAFIKGVCGHLPNARITFDKFHVIAHASHAVDKMPSLRIDRFQTLTLRSSDSNSDVQRKEFALDLPPTRRALEACTRSAILAFGTPPNVSAPLRHASFWSSIAQLRRPPNPRHQAFSKSLPPKRHNRHRTTALSKLRPRPAPLHPQAHPKICPRTMTHFSRCQTRLSLLCASLRRHRLPRPPTKSSFFPTSITAQPTFVAQPSS